MYDNVSPIRLGSVMRHSSSYLWTLGNRMRIIYQKKTDQPRTNWGCCDVLEGQVIIPAYAIASKSETYIASVATDDAHSQRTQDTLAQPALCPRVGVEMRKIYNRATCDISDDTRPPKPPRGSTSRPWKQLWKYKDPMRENRHHL
eukprot:6178370-Pleurochrysis_carterae.AAC.1